MLDILSANGVRMRVCGHAPETNDMALINLVLYESWVAFLVQQSKELGAREALLDRRQRDIAELAAMRGLRNIEYIDAC